jgi:mRNA interferase MazF
MPRYQTFDIVVVPFPYSDRLAEKRRPAVVISDPSLEVLNDVVWVAMITSTNTGLSGSVALQDIAMTGLDRISFVRPAKIATLETSRVLRKTGQLSPVDGQNLRVSLKGFAGF